MSMKKSLRAKRMARHHDRHKGQASLNLTSLMDIFTILVFFLMVNSSDTQVLKNTKEIIMPISVAKQMPKETLIVQVSNEQLVVQGRFISTVSDVLALEDDLIPALAEELKYQASKRTVLTEQEKQFGRQITIQGHNEVEYRILKKIMATCAETDYRDISLAVTRKFEKKEGGG